MQLVIIIHGLKRESLKILVLFSKCYCKTALIDVLYFHLAGPLEYFFGKWRPWVCETKMIFLFVLNSFSFISEISHYFLMRLQCVLDVFSVCQLIFL